MRSYLVPVGVLGLVGMMFAGCGGDSSSETPNSGAKGGSAGKSGSAGKGGNTPKGGTSGTGGESGMSMGGTGGSKAGKGGGGGKGGSKGGTGGSGGTSAGAGAVAGEAGMTSGGGTGGGGRGGSSGMAGTGAESGNAGESGAGAGGQSSGTIEGCAGSGDSEWAKVIAFVPCSVTLADAAALSTITPYNSPTVSSTPAGAPGGASCALGSASAYDTAVGFRIALPSAIGTGDFTLEFAVYQTAFRDPNDVLSNIVVANNGYPPAAMDFPTFFSQDGNLVQYVGGSGVTVYKDTGSALDTWQQYAASRVSGTTYVFRNGTLLTSFVDATDYAGTTVNVGVQENGTYNALMGSIGQIRITKGVGRHTAAYAVCADGFASGS